MVQLDLWPTEDFPSREWLKESELVALRLQRRRVLSLEVELTEARLVLGRLVFVLYVGAVEPDSDEDLRRDG